MHVGTGKFINHVLPRIHDFQASPPQYGACTHCQCSFHQVMQHVRLERRFVPTECKVKECSICLSKKGISWSKLGAQGTSATLSHLCTLCAEYRTLSQRQASDAATTSRASNQCERRRRVRRRTRAREYALECAYQRFTRAGCQRVDITIYPLLHLPRNASVATRC